jgi:cephalosporin-C deacetylase-like acetyl esterase
MIRATVIALVVSAGFSLHAQEPALADRLKDLDDKTLSAARFTDRALPGLLGEDARARRDAVNRRETEAWLKVKALDDWKAFRDPKINALRDSLHLPKLLPQPAKNARVCETIEGEGYRIENIIFPSHDHVQVTANLYLPAKTPKSMPGILIVHSHHNPKTQSELQDMGIMWAKLGCAVLVIDQLGHGERRFHPFIDEKSYPEKFRPSRQDYYFRYNLSLQLYAAGQSLMGWMVADQMQGVTLLLERGADSKKIIILGSVAGGGDVAAVTAALDERISGAVIFNFGGPQGGTVFPPDAETKFNYAGGGSWESTRNLHLSARDGFLPWVIVGSIAPRRLVYAHEFAWDRDHDPVWKRLLTIYKWHDAADNLGSIHGEGKVTGTGPGNTHCNNIGAFHRKDIYPLLKKWFDIPIPAEENKERRPAGELKCFEGKEEERFSSTRNLELNRATNDAADQARDPAKGYKEKPESLRDAWRSLLGDIEPRGSGKVLGKATEKVGDVTVETLLLQAEDNVLLPMVLLLPKSKGKRATVIGVCQEGKREFLKQNARDIAELLQQGVAVCLVDVRGIGESRPDAGRGRQSSATSISALELMLGQTLVGSRLRDVRTVLAWLRTREEIDGKRLAIWGESFASVNAADANLAVPLDAEKLPHQSEPFGALMALLTPLFEDGVKGYGYRGLRRYGWLSDSPFAYVPHDVIIPGVVAVGDVFFIRRTLGKRVRYEGEVNAQNVVVTNGKQETPARWLMQSLKE